MPIPFIKEFDDLAENMADPPVNRPIANAVAEFGQSVCDSISANPSLYAPTILQSPLVAACTPYWDSQGYSAPVETESLLPGAQCPVPYLITWTATNFQTTNCSTSAVESSPGPFVRSATVTGPITNVNFTEVSGSCGPGRRGWSLNVTNGTGAVVTVGTVQTSFPASVYASSINFGTITAVRTDGLADDCGEGEPSYEPGPSPAPDPGPLPPGTGPQLDIRGNVILVLPGAIQISPDFTLELSPGEINLGSGTSGSPSVPPLPGDELEGEGGDEGGGENDFGDPPENERWVGCCIKITDRPVGSGVIPQSVPNDIYPTTIGNVRLKFQGATGPTQYDTPITNRQETSCIWEPVRGLNTVGAFVNLLPGYSYTITPYSVPLEQ